jgi:hypothetical protein
MTQTNKEQSKEFQNFDATMRKILSVPHEELKRREAQWKIRRKAREAT